MGHAEEAIDLTAFDDLARRFAEQELAKTTLDNDHYPFDAFDRRLWEQASELGLQDLAVPESLGGLGQGMDALTTVLRALATVDGSVAALMLSQAYARQLIATLATPARAATWLNATDRGVPQILASALYDDPTDLPTSLVGTVRGEALQLHGRLDHLIGLPEAHHAIVPVFLPEQSRHELVALDLHAEGIRVSDPVLGLGLKACPVGDLAVDATVKPDCRLGEKGGITEYLAITDSYRLAVVATALGVLQGSYNLALEYAQERHQAKKLIVEHHMVRQMLAGMISWLDVGDAALQQALAGQVDAKAGPTQVLSVHQVVLSAVARATTDGVQLLGGNGYMHEYGQEKRMRDAKQLQAMLGASPTRRMLILERALQAG